MIIGVIFLLIIPVFYIILGLIFWLKPPKKINGIAGYRTARAMKSQEVWEFANKLSGKLLLILGIVSVIISFIAGLIVMDLSTDIFGVCIISLILLQTLALVLVIAGTEQALKKKFD